MRTLLTLLALAVLPAKAQTATTTDICDRTPQVRDAILKTLETDYCAAVDLAGVSNLFLYKKQLTSLKTDDFDGLSSLRSLSLDKNQLTTLPDGVFDGLDNLQRLRLDKNQLTTLPVGVFGELRSLQGLELNENQLTALPEGLFDGLSSLEFLDLTNNRLVGLTFEDPLFAALDCSATILFFTQTDQTGQEMSPSVTTIDKLRVIIPEFGRMYCVLNRSLRGDD